MCLKAGRRSSSSKLPIPAAHTWQTSYLAASSPPSAQSSGLSLKLVPRAMCVYLQCILLHNVRPSVHECNVLASTLTMSYSAQITLKKKKKDRRGGGEGVEKRLTELSLREKCFRNTSLPLSQPRLSVNCVPSWLGGGEGNLVS